MDTLNEEEKDRNEAWTETEMGTQTKMGLKCQKNECVFKMKQLDATSTAMSSANTTHQQGCQLF